MYDNSHLPSYMNAPGGPFDTQFSSWSLNGSNSMAIMGSTMLEPSTSSSSSSSFCFPYSPEIKQKTSTTYVNLGSTRHTILSRPKSTMLSTYVNENQSNTYWNDLRQRYESKSIIGIVKPIVHPVSDNSSEKDIDVYGNKKLLQMTATSDYHFLTRSSKPSTSSASPPLPLPPQTSVLPNALSTGTSSVVFRSRRTPSNGHLNTQPPAVPKRHSSISGSRPSSSYRTSRTISTCSSMNQNHEHQTIPPLASDDPIEKRRENPIIDIKRLEMFYSSVGTFVKSARSSARLYLTNTRQLNGIEDWSFQQRGVPLWVYNTGANLKRERQIRLIMAQHDSCFALWSTSISNQVELRLPKDHFITCWLPDSNLLAVLKFEQEDACRLFFRHYFEILEQERRTKSAETTSIATADHIDINQSAVKSKSTVSSKEIPRRYSRLRSFAQRPEKEQQKETFELRRCRSLSKIRTVKKSSISGPINFEHINHVSGNTNQDRISSGTMTLRSLHASMSNLLSQGSFTDRSLYSDSKRTSIFHESRTTAV